MKRQIKGDIVIFDDCNPYNLKAYITLLKT